MPSSLREHRDILLAVGLALVSVVDAILRDLPHLPALLPLTLLVPLTLAWRVRAPLPVLAANLATILAIEAVWSEDPPWPLGAVALVAVYSAAAHTRGRSAGVAVAMIVATVLASVSINPPDGWTNVVIGLVFTTLVFRAAWFAGTLTARRRDRAVANEAARQERARAALRDERARIARELHDVLAHALSVVVLQSRGGRHALDDGPDDARPALDAIERTATEALAELRRLLDVLRDDDEAAELAPQPSLARVDALVADVRAAGLPVELRREGEPRELPAGVDLCAYRVVQEALTNALRHAGPAVAHVVLRFDDDALDIEIADTGSGTPNGEAAGVGLAGMRERVALFGGRLESGPRAEGGYLVRARLPL